MQIASCVCNLSEVGTLLFHKTISIFAHIQNAKDTLRYASSDVRHGHQERDKGGSVM